MLKILSAVCLGLSPAISSQFTFSFKLCVAAKNAKKIATIPLLGVQGRSRSSMLTNRKSPSKVLVMICSKSAPICNCFHTIQANSGKITTFVGRISYLTPSFEENPLTQGHEILSLKTRVLVAAHCEEFVILACTILIGLKGVTDTRTDGRTPRP